MEGGDQEQAVAPRRGSLLQKRKRNRMSKYERKVCRMRLRMGFPAEEIYQNRRHLRPHQFKSRPRPSADPSAEPTESTDKTRNQRFPPPIAFSSPVFSMDFHPDRPLLAAGLISGSVQIYSYRSGEEGGNALIGGLRHHQQSVRSIMHSRTGDQLYCASSDGSLSVIDTSLCSVDHHWSNAHKAPINRIYSFYETTIVTGDDEGVIKVWDLRQGQRKVEEYREHTNFITDFTSQDYKILLATGADGKLSSYDMRKKKPFIISEEQEGEMLSCRIVREGSKVVAGTSSGNMRIFNWGQFGAISDSFPLLTHAPHVFSEFLLPTPNSSRVYAGCSDGRVRVLNILPNCVVEDVCVHGQGYPIEAMAQTPDQSLLATAAHDQRIRFWDVSSLDHYSTLSQNSKSEELSDSDSEEEEEEDEEIDGDHQTEPPPISSLLTPTSNKKGGASFFSGF